MILPPSDEIIRQVADYYAGKLAQHGPSARGVDWNSEESHEKRHLQFLRLLGDERDASILDLGCGYGDFLSFLRARGFSGSYTGYDVSTDMIVAARRRHGEGADRRWCVGAIPSEASDYAIASGILNVKGDTPIDVWAGYVRDTIDVLACAGRRGFAFNILTLSSDPALRRPNLYYADPVQMLSYCLTRFGRSIALLQDYGLWEFTVLVRYPPASSV